ncbi:MAG: polysaccharide deacetylase family protein [Tissierellia bacterium]|nr:polysaccharide deacetylase family protein [Tissierellia bacterium]
MILKKLLVSAGALIGIWAIYGPMASAFARKKPKRWGELVLTFDDGPDEIVTPKVLDVLKRKNLKGIFFLTGTAIKGREHIVRRIAKEGHEIGVHGQSHINHLWQSPSRTKRDVQEGYDSIVNCGVVPIYYRGPYGAYNTMTLLQCKKLGLQVLHWDGIHGDWEINPVGKLAYSLNHVHMSGGVVVLHDGRMGKGQIGANEKMVEELEMFLILREKLVA